MKWMISLLILVLLIPIKVLYIESEEIALLPIVSVKEMTLTQYHSVSLTEIEAVVMARKDGLYVVSVSYKDQGGAGMPNPHEMVHMEAFKGVLNQELALPLRFADGSDNAIEVLDDKISFHNGGLIDIKHTSIIFLLLDRIGVI